MSRHLLGAHSPDDYEAAVTAAAQLVADRLRTVDRPYSGATVDELEAAVGAVDLDAPVGALGAALDETARLFVDHAIWFHEPRYVAHLNCPVAVPALAADTLLSAINTSVDTFDQSTAGTFIERRLVDWTAGRIGYGDRADGVFTSGGTASNLHALLLARDDVRARLPVALGDLRVLATANAHFSVAKAARLLGLSTESVVTVAVDSAGRMSVPHLRRALDALTRDGLTPMAVVATAGTTDRGAIDPVAGIADVCAEVGVWLHVDAAYGCGLLVSQTRRHWLDGIERADSVTVDFHKSFFQPVASSAVIVRDGRDLRHGGWHADYLNPKRAGLPNQVDKSLQTTRRLDCLKLWMTLRVMGAEEIGRAFDAVIDLARTAHALVEEHPDLESATTPSLSTVLFRYRPAGLDVDGADSLGPRIRRALFDEGRVIVAGTTIDGHHWLKLTLLNPSTTPDHLREVLGQVVTTGAALADRQAVAA